MSQDVQVGLLASKIRDSADSGLTHCSNVIDVFTAVPQSSVASMTRRVCRDKIQL